MLSRWPTPTTKTRALQGWADSTHLSDTCQVLAGIFLPKHLFYNEKFSSFPGKLHCLLSHSPFCPGAGGCQEVGGRAGDKLTNTELPRQAGPAFLKFLWKLTLTCGSQTKEPPCWQGWEEGWEGRLSRPRTHRSMQLGTWPQALTVAHRSPVYTTSRCTAADRQSLENIRRCLKENRQGL